MGLGYLLYLLQHVFRGISHPLTIAVSGLFLSSRLLPNMDKYYY